MGTRATFDPMTHTYELKRAFDRGASGCSMLMGAGRRPSSKVLAMDRPPDQTSRRPGTPEGGRNPGNNAHASEDDCAPVDDLLADFLSMV